MKGYDESKYPSSSTKEFLDKDGKPILDEKGKSLKLKLPMPGKEGYTENYRYRGDKVFGYTDDSVNSEIKIYEGKTGDAKSVESDHQMVYAFFEYKKKKTTAEELGEIPEDLKYNMSEEEEKKLKAMSTEELTAYLADTRGGRRRRRKTRKHRVTHKKQKGGKRRTKKRSGRKTRRRHKA
jgi:hypothetical protein